MTVRHRRAFLAAALLSALGLSGARADEAGRDPPAAARVADLSHPMREGMPVWPGGVPFAMTRTADYDQGFRAHRFEMGENTGTHLDAPAHFIPGGRTVDEISAAELVVPAVVIDVREEAAADPDYRLTAERVRAFEARAGKIPQGSLVILHTGWHRRFADPEAYVNMDADGVMHFPGFGADAARLLVRRDVAGIAIDTLSIDPGESADFAAHEAMLGAGKYQIENLADPGPLPATGATAIVGVLPVAGGTQAQARVLALVP